MIIIVIIIISNPKDNIEGAVAVNPQTPPIEETDQTRIQCRTHKKIVV